MPKISELQAPRRIKVRLYGQDVALDYNPAILTQDFLDEYKNIVNDISNSNLPESKKFERRRELVARQLAWIDLQDDNGADIAPTADGLKQAGLTLADLNQIELFINLDVQERSDPTVPTEASSSAG